MKVILFMAISLNGIIARENNEEDFLSEINWTSMVSLAKKFRCIIWGRRTHEVVKTWDQHYHDDLKDIRKIVISKDVNFNTGRDYILVDSPKEALDLLKKERFENALLSGVSGLNASFAKEKLIDEIILNIEPVL